MFLDIEMGLKILDSHILRKEATHGDWKEELNLTAMQSGSCLYPTWLVQVRFVESLMSTEVEY